MKLMTRNITITILASLLLLISCSPKNAYQSPENSSSSPPAISSTSESSPESQRGTSDATSKERTKEQSQKIAADIVKDPKLTHWKGTFDALRKLAEAGFPSDIDVAGDIGSNRSTLGPSYQYILKNYGPADRVETTTVARERLVYWYGPLGVIVSKEDGQIWGFGGDPPKK